VRESIAAALWKISQRWTTARGCVNFRDVGEWLHVISRQRLLPERRILRGGKLRFVESPAQIGSLGTTINLRNGADPGSSASMRITGTFRSRTTMKIPDENTGGAAMASRHFSMLVHRRITLPDPLSLHLRQRSHRSGG